MCKVLILLPLLIIAALTLSPAHSMFAQILSVPAAPSPQVGVSTEAKRAIEFIAEREGVPAENLVAFEESRYTSVLGQTFQPVTLLDRRGGGRIFKVLVDVDSGEVRDRADVEAAEEEARRTRYGKLQPDLYDRLRLLGDDESVLVTIWVVAEPGKSLPELEAEAFAALGAKYPQAAEAIARGGKPMDVDDPELAKQIYQEYVNFLDAQAARRIVSLVETLEAQGFTVRPAKGLPAVTALLPKRVILEIADRGDVGTVYLAEGEVRLMLDTAVPTDRVPIVWARGLDGTGVEIAVVEPDNVDFSADGNEQCPDVDNNCFQRPGDYIQGALGTQSHATLVASVAASYHGFYRGIAYGAVVSSIGMQGDLPQDAVDALITALDLGADVVNLSVGQCTTSTLFQDLDRAFDYYARSRNRSFVAAGGSLGACGNYIVSSPGKAWNVLTVGAYDNMDDADWENDAMADFSGYLNPSGGNEKKNRKWLLPELAFLE